MWQEGQQDDDESFDDLPESFVRCALHQAKISRERWRFWSGSVPSNVSIRLHRLESLISMKAPIERQETGNEVASPSQRMPNVTRGTIDSSQSFLPQLCRCSSPIDQYLTERIQPKQNIVIQGPNVRRRPAEKARFYFWCCH